MTIPADPLGALTNRVRDNSHIFTAVLIAMVTTAVIVTLFIVQAHSYSSAINARDEEIGRLAVNYAKLRDQDFALQIAPAAPSLAQVEDPLSGVPGIPLPKSFTASFPDGYFTCVDKAGDGNYACTVTRPVPSSPSTR